MRSPRHIQIRPYAGQHFHVISRVVDRRFIFGEEEKRVFMRYMRQLEGFSGVRILAYCIMSNHFHILLHVPVRPEQMTQKEIWDRMKFIYPESRMSEFQEMLEDFRNSGQSGRIREFYDRITQRMYDLSSFVKELKQKFSVYFNKRTGRKGTLWEERFKSVLVEGNDNCLLHVASYIDLNPVRAGIAKIDAPYPWSSYGEACSGGHLAQSALTYILHPHDRGEAWEQVREKYKQILNLRTASENADQKVLRRSHLKFSSRIRSFSEGFVIGTREFIEEFYREKIKWLHPGRKKIAYNLEVKGEDGVHSYRNVPNRNE